MVSSAFQGLAASHFIAMLSISNLYIQTIQAVVMVIEMVPPPHYYFYCIYLLLREAPSFFFHN